jgi:hypothetical protein
VVSKPQVRLKGKAQFRLAGLTVKPVNPVQYGMLSVFTFLLVNGLTGQWAQPLSCEHFAQ